MNPQITKINNLIAKSTKYIIRDFYELEHLQNSQQSKIDFVARSYSKIKERFLDEFENFEYDFIHFSDFKKEIIEDGTYLLVNPIDSINNLARSIAFFGTIVTVIEVKKSLITPIISVISLPIINEIIYSQKGSGVWMEKYSNDSGSKSKRLRVSSTKDPNYSFVSVENIEDFNLLISSNIKYKNLRIFGSPSYDLSLLASGKIDSLVLSNKDLCLFFAAQLISVESGGKYNKMDNNDNYYIFSNMNL